MVAQNGLTVQGGNMMADTMQGTGLETDWSNNEKEEVYPRGGTDGH